MDATAGLNASFPVSLKVTGGVANEGYWGVPVMPATIYRLTFWAKADKPGLIDASIESTDGSTVFAKAAVSDVETTWHKVSATLTPTSDAAPVANGRLVLGSGKSRTTWLSLVSLLPPTFNARPNGNRRDLMQLLVDMKPKYLRFPGGNYVDGNTFKDRYPWKQTLGPIEDRPGHASPWGYQSTDGMGLLEYLEWCEDMKAKPSNPGQKGPTPNMNCALADAAFLTGLERNSDIVQMSCYAPLLVSVNPGGRQWGVNLIGYNSLNSFGSPSYYAQKMFMENLGDQTVLTTIAGEAKQQRGDQTIPGLFASTTRDFKTGMLYLKVVNRSRSGLRSERRKGCLNRNYDRPERRSQVGEYA